MANKKLLWIGSAAAVVALLTGALVYDANVASAEPAAHSPASAGTIETALDQAFAAANEPGVVIVSLDAAGPAAKAGVLRGDIVTKFGDTDVNDLRSLNDALAKTKTGDSVTLTLTRGGAAQTVSVTIGDRNGQPYLGIVPGFGVPFGRGFGMIRAFGAGANVISVTVGSPAETAGLKAGDVIVSVNGKTGRGNALSQIVASGKPGDEITISVDRSGTKTDIKATLGDNPAKPGSAYLGVTVGRGGPKGGRPFQRGPGAPVAPGDPVAPGTPGPGNRTAPRGRQAPGNPAQVQPGATVVFVVAGGPAEAAGVKQGDVITALDGANLANSRALVDAIAAHKPGDSVKLTIQRAGSTAAVEISVTLSATSDDTGKAYLGVQLGDRRVGPGARGPAGANPQGGLNSLRERMRQYMPGQTGPGGGRGAGAPLRDPNAPQAPQL